MINTYLILTYYLLTGATLRNIIYCSLFALTAFCFHFSIRVFRTLLICLVFSGFLQSIVFECFVPNIRLLLKTGTYANVNFTVLTYFASNLDSVKLSQ